MNLFGDHSIEDQANSLAAFMHEGEIFSKAKQSGTNIRNLIVGLACELFRVETAMNSFADDYFIKETNEFISYWEGAVGIPDSCIPVGNTLQQRRDNIMAKFAKMNIITEQDFKELATYFGFTIDIVSGGDAGVFPLAFPALFFSSSKEARFTMIVDFPTDKRVFPIPFPVIFSGGFSNIVICLFNKLRPANVRVIYRFKS